MWRTPDMEIHRCVTSFFTRYHLPITLYLFCIILLAWYLTRTYTFGVVVLDNTNPCIWDICKFQHCSYELCGYTKHLFSVCKGRGRWLSYWLLFFNAFIYQVGDVIYTPGCFIERVCEGNNEISSSDMSCDENAYCGLDEDGQHGCHCRAGYDGDGTFCSGKYLVILYLVVGWLIDFRNRFNKNSFISCLYFFTN